MADPPQISNKALPWPDKLKLRRVIDEKVDKAGAAKFEEASRNGANLVPLYKCIFSDHLTPVVAFRCLVKEGDWEVPSFLFESVEQGSQGTNMGRYSVVGAQPAMEIVAKREYRVYIGP
ncbi:hypothetical protein HPP92_011542 [Vanilla planifolia]|uniref:Anthranilate synthase component I N-terminal domain-containing protein n=1 Tax=Vanilla planifolia TaxID=51239 RepID=A0A835UYJ3_VANPL|nr:hypothetical protein HPP92_011542 [Vanilla planifolia]